MPETRGGAILVKNETKKLIQSKWQLAYHAFQHDLPELLKQELRGQWVLYDGAKRIATGPDRDQLYQHSQELGLFEEDIFVDLVTPAVEDIDADLILH